MSADLLHPKYRADIDGLRAVAILAVVGFHAFPVYVPGGFIGVDIFFVISGFLISTIIIKNLECGSFDFVEFYRRRVHRIFPALLLVLIVSGAFAWFALLADEFMQLGKHVAGGAAFASNFVLWSEADYFDNASGTKPLLHLWSLGVEEQFYLAWPFLLWLAWRVGKGLLAMTLITAAASFGLNLFLFRSDSVVAFYMPLTRLWEFHAGALVAYVFLHEQQILSACQQHGVWVRMVSFFRAIPVGVGFHRDLMSLLGAILIAYGLFGLASDAGYPGWNALLPVSGAALLVAAGAKAWINKTILAHRIFVWFGLISYPLYLWHWPLLSFVQIIEGRVPHRDARITAVLLAVLLAWLTYKYVENPIRFGRHSKRKTVLLSLMMLLVGLAGVMVYSLEGVKARSAANLEMANLGDVGDHAYYKYSFEHAYACTADVIRQQAPDWEGVKRCHQSKRSNKLDVAIVGDSHAEHLFPGLAKSMESRNVVCFVKSGLPYLGNEEFNHVFGYVLGNEDIGTIILSAYWASYMHKQDRGVSLRSALDGVVKKLVQGGKRVYLVNDVPNFSSDPKICKYKRAFGAITICTEPNERNMKNYAELVQDMDFVVRNNPGVGLIDVAKFLCDERRCYMARDGVLFYRDSNHLNIDGSLYMGRQIVDAHPELQ